MTLYNIIPTTFSGFGCIANTFCLLYFLLYERKGLTCKLFILLSWWNILNSLVVTIRVWLPISTSKFMMPLYAWVLNNDGFVLIVITMTRMIKICAPFYRIKSKRVWLAMIIWFIYISTVNVTINSKGQYTAKHMFNFGRWQLAKFLNDIILSLLSVLAVLIPNIVSGIKLLKPGAVKASENNIQAVRTVMIISVIFFLSNSLLYLHIARNLKWVITGSLAPLIPGYNALLGMFFYRLLMMLNAVCDPVVFFIRNKNFRKWALGIPRSIRIPVTVSKILTRSTVSTTLNDTSNNE